MRERPFKQLRIAGKRHRVLWDQKMEGDDFGDYHPVTLKLRVSEGLAPDEERETLLHEVLHAVAVQVDAELTEPKHGRFSVALFEAFRNNPKLVAYLFDEQEDDDAADA